MKKVLMTMMVVAAAMTATAQGLPVKDDGSYEVKEVVVTDSVSAQELYDRAMVALSRWSDGNAEKNMDYHDRDAGTLIYKGIHSLGFKNVFLGDGWERYMNYTLKVRCKDGKAQVTVTVPTLLFVYNKNGVKQTYTTSQMNSAVVSAKGKKKERGEAILAEIKSYSESMVKAMMGELLKKGIVGDDDDF
jgi:hypothetical protein